MSRSDLVVFSRQLSIMVNSGVQLRDALNLLENAGRDEDSRVIIRTLVQRIESGWSLAQASSLFPRVFSPVFIATLKMSEESGQIGQSFDTLSNWLEKNERTVREVKAALVYPCLVVVLSLLLSVMFFTFIFPTFVNSLSSSEDLPLLTRILALLSSCLTSPVFWLALIGATALGFQTYRQNSRKLSFRLKVWKICSVVPLVGPLQRDIASARFAATMAVMMDTGVDILSAFRLASGVSGSAAMEHALMEGLGFLRDGGNLSDYLQSRRDLFPELLIALVISGEEAAQLPKVFQLASESLDESSSDRIRALVSVLEPMLVFGVSIFVGIFVLGIALPMYQVIGDL